MPLILFAVAAVIAPQSYSSEQAAPIPITAGDGIPVVFLHGAISDHRVWLPLQDAIADERLFVTYDQRFYGVGQWGPVPDDFSPDTHADDLIELIETLDRGPVHLVTWSASGDFGTRAALRRPELFHSMVHYEPAIGSYLDGVPGAAHVSADLFSRFGNAVKAMQDNRLEDAALRFIEAVFELPEGAAEHEPAPWPQIWKENGHTVPTYLGRKPGNQVRCNALMGLRTPTLVLIGSDSHPRYAMMAERMAQCQPQAMTATLQGVNHDGPYRKPDELAAMIEGFIGLFE